MSAIKDGALQHVSASQIKTFQACQRKWALDKIWGLRQPGSAATERGENLHKQMERWFLEGVEPTHASCKLAANHPDVPRPGPDIYIEYPNSYKMELELAGVGLKGRIDLFDTSRLSEEGTVYVYDWKSTKNFRYTKNHEQLNRDLQGLLYAHFIFNHLPSCREVVFTHVYLLAPDNVATTPADVDTSVDVSTFAGGVKVVQNDGWSKDDVLRLLPDVERDIKNMVTLAATLAGDNSTLADVPACFSECAAYGGCYYQNVCHNGLSVEKARDLKDLREWKTEVDTEVKAVSLSFEQLAKQRKEAQMDRVNPPDAPMVPVARPYVPPPQPDVKLPANLANIAADGFVLLVDCNPQEGFEGSFQYLSFLIKERADVIAAEKGVQDVRQIKFGEGTTALCATFIKSPPKGVIVANTGGLQTAVVDVLTPLAKLVIRGRVG